MPRDKSLWTSKLHAWRPVDKDAALIIRPALPIDRAPTAPRFVPSATERIAEEHRLLAESTAKRAAAREAANEARRASKEAVRAALPATISFAPTRVGEFRSLREAVRLLSASQPAWQLHGRNGSITCTCSVALPTGTIANRTRSARTFNTARRRATRALAEYLLELYTSPAMAARRAPQTEVPRSAAANI